MAKRAILYDQNDREIAHLSFAEIDDYSARGLVERLTPIRAATHRFRLLVPTTVDIVIPSETTLTDDINRANAGACDNDATILWAQRKVRKWPHVGDTKAVRVACRT